MAGPRQPRPARRPRASQEPAPPLGSISLPGGSTTPPATTCEQCGASELTHVRMNLTDGESVTFVSCQRCEHRAWYDAAGVSLPIAVVLARSAKKT